MERLIELLNRIPPYIVIIYLGIFITLEHFWPLARDRKDRFKHLLNNSGLLIVATIVNIFISIILVNWIQYVDKNNIGLMNLLDLSPAVMAFLSIIILDFTSYFIHRIIHRSKFIWRFHKVHHGEMDLDSSTAFKFHPLEAIIVFPLLLAEIGLMGISFPGIILYNVLILPVFFILHSNLKYPKWFEKIFSPIFATPEFHRVHHSNEQKFTDSNYGDIFSLWDRIFGTFQKTDTNSLEYGLKDLSDKKNQSFWNMIITPFKK